VGIWSEIIAEHFRESAEAKQQTAGACSEGIEQSALILAEAFRTGHKVLFCGNGGSAADSQHLATEFVIRLSAERDRRSLPAIALTTDTSALTAGTNDFGVERMFARQVEGLGQADDVLIGISTSGNSPNIIEAVKTARAQGLTTIGLLGGTGGACRDLVDVPIVVPNIHTNRIQETHITIGHILCDLVERILFD
jgi:D-sedoheptulose 7-phosphate isomerase